MERIHKQELSNKERRKKLRKSGEVLNLLVVMLVSFCGLSRATSDSPMIDISRQECPLTVYCKRNKRKLLNDWERYHATGCHQSPACVVSRDFFRLTRIYFIFFFSLVSFVKYLVYSKDQVCGRFATMWGLGSEQSSGRD